MDRQYNGKKKKTNKDLQNTSKKAKDWATRTQLKTGGERKCSRMVSSFWSTSGTCRATLVVALTWKIQAKSIIVQ
jgi:hypothetical protein